MCKPLTGAEIQNIDKQLAQLYDKCEILTEKEVKALCQRVHIYI